MYTCEEIDCKFNFSGVSQRLFYSVVRVTWPLLDSKVGISVFLVFFSVRGGLAGPFVDRVACG